MSDPANPRHDVGLLGCVRRDVGRWPALSPSCRGVPKAARTVIRRACGMCRKDWAWPTRGCQPRLRSMTGTSPFCVGRWRRWNRKHRESAGPRRAEDGSDHENSRCLAWGEGVHAARQPTVVDCRCDAGKGLVFWGRRRCHEKHTVGTENRGVKRKMGNEGCGERTERERKQSPCQGFCFQQRSGTHIDPSALGRRVIEHTSFTRDRPWLALT